MRYTKLAALLAGVLLLSRPLLAQERYWSIAGDTNQVWSLSGNTLVPKNDASYVAWVSAGNVVTRIGSSSELYDVIKQTYPTHLAASAPGLDALGLLPGQAYEWRRDAGLTITYVGASGLDGRYAITLEASQNLTGLVVGVLAACVDMKNSGCNDPQKFPGGGSTYTLRDQDGRPHTMTAIQMGQISFAVRDYIAALYNARAVGDSGGTPAWPSSSVTVGP